MKNNSIFDSFPVIQLDCLTLRELKITDVKDFYNYITHPKVAEFLSEEEIPKDFNEAVQELLYWANLFKFKHSLYWAIEENKSKKLIGTCGFNNWNITHKRVEISYDLNYDYWNQGIMTKALEKICNFAFNKMEINRIQATVAFNNFRSIKLLEKLGFEKEGLMTKFAIIHNKNVNYFMYAKIK